MFRASDWDFICTKNKSKYDLMIYNPVSKELFLEENVGEERVNGVDSFGGSYHAAQVSRATFYDIFDKIGGRDSYAFGFFNSLGGGKEEKIDKKELIPKDVIFNAIRGKFSEAELEEVVQKDMEKADYYDFEAFMAMTKKFMNGEVSTNYYTGWLIVVSWALQANPFKFYSKKGQLYENMSYALDGASFNSFEEEKEQECYSIIAELKYYNHRRANLGKSEIPPFRNKNGVVVYVCFDFCNGENVFYKLCVVDTKKKVFTIKSIVEPIYFEDVNYTFVDSFEFDGLTNEYYEYFYDRDMDVGSYIKESPYIRKC